MPFFLGWLQLASKSTSLFIYCALQLDFSRNSSFSGQKWLNSYESNKQLCSEKKRSRTFADVRGMFADVRGRSRMFADVRGRSRDSSRMFADVRGKTTKLIKNIVLFNLAEIDEKLKNATAKEEKLHK